MLTFAVTEPLTCSLGLSSQNRWDGCLTTVSRVEILGSNHSFAGSKLYDQEQVS